MSRLRFRRPPVSAARTGKIAIPAIVLVTLLAVAAGCGGSTSYVPQEVSTAPPTVIDKGPVSQEGVQQILDRKLGQAGIAGQPVIREIKLIPEAGGVFVDISVNRTASCHPGQLVGATIDVTKAVMNSVFRYSDVTRVQIALYGPTEEPKDKDLVAARVMFTKEQSAKTDWATFSDQTAAELASEYWIEPTIYDNWKKYGSGIITDEALKAAANSAAATGSSTTATP